ncbi:hypothetical protein [Desulfosediminicola ganghwensis]|uniref:hypothetical protein n=1 Tax=Desulfosediminicola ganghwensis TaxID=2569540 RepID=UPI0010ACDACB|nr:hypothetical protein [Desulfosediminicola ganghwensis]
MNRCIHIIILASLFLGISLPEARAAVVEGRYVTVEYNSDGQLLREFNSNLKLSRKLRYNLKKLEYHSVEDEVAAKLDILVEKAEIILDMFPANLDIKVVLLPSRYDIAAVYRQKYQKKFNHIAYYSLSENTIYISVDDAKLKVVAHELGHAVVDHYFQVRPPYEIHELMAEYVERNVSR